MKSNRAMWAALALGMLLQGCGGGGGGGGGTSTPVAPAVTGSVTASLTDSQQTAADLVAKALDGASNALAVSSFTSLPLAAALSAPASAGPQRVTAFATAQRQQNCALSGTVAVQLNFASTSGPTVGDVYGLTMSNCNQIAGITLTGLADLTVARWTSGQSYAFGFSVSNLSMTQGGQNYGPYTFGGQYDLNSGVETWSYTVSGQSVVGDPTVQRSGSSATIGAGTVRANLGSSGFVELAYTQWVFDTTTHRATSWSVTVAGASGTQAVISVGNTGYDVALTIGGTTKHYVVPF
ncbi:MAG: hypothetical protein RJA44_2678 [Pseudomonadota bacterium]|jgi:hypothetical protein